MANTIAGVNLAAIAEESLPSLQTTFAPLAGLQTDFSSDVEARGASVTTRIPTNPTAQDLTSGYGATDVAMTAKTINLDTFYGFVWGFSDDERSKSAVILNDLFIQPALQALGEKVFGDMWDLVVNANFGTSDTITAANFDRDDLVDVAATLTDQKKAPKQGRSIIANPSYYGALVKTLNSSEVPGIGTDKAEGIMPRAAGFDIFESDIADANAENLGAFAFHRSSLLMASRSVDATGATDAGVEVTDVEIPGLGIPVQWRRWYDPDSGVLKYSVGLLYGFAVGNDMGVRITSA